MLYAGVGAACAVPIAALVAIAGLTRMRERGNLTGKLAIFRGLSCLENNATPHRCLLGTPRARLSRSRVSAGISWKADREGHLSLNGICESALLQLQPLQRGVPVLGCRSPVKTFNVLVTHSRRPR